MLNPFMLPHRLRSVQCGRLHRIAHATALQNKQKKIIRLRKKNKKKKNKLHNLFECCSLLVNIVPIWWRCKIASNVCVCYSLDIHVFTRTIQTQDIVTGILWFVFHLNEKKNGKCWMLVHFTCWIFNFKYAFCTRKWYWQCSLSLDRELDAFLRILHIKINSTRFLAFAILFSGKNDC